VFGVRGAGVYVMDEVGIGLEELVAACTVRQSHLVHLRQPCTGGFSLCADRKVACVSAGDSVSVCAKERVPGTATDVGVNR
jgi:hypothetical protein